MRLYFNVGIFIFAIFLLLSCGNDENKANRVNKLATIAEKCIGQEIVVSDSLSFYNPFHIDKDSLDIYDTDYKIYTNINISCGSCVDELRSWNEFSKEIDPDRVSVVFICRTESDFLSFEYLCESGNMEEVIYFPFLLDRSKGFMKENSFMKATTHYETVLTDNNNKILALGNPILSQKFKTMYLEVINSDAELKR